MVRTLWKSCCGLFHAWRAARRRSELRELSDRTLKDIGLSRGQIEQLFR